MFSDKYKKDNEKITLDNSFKNNLASKIKRGEVKMIKNNIKLKRVLAATITMSFIIGGYFMLQIKNNNTDKQIATGQKQDENTLNNNNITNGSIGETSMMAFLNYNGKNYRYVNHAITKNMLNDLKGEKLGITNTGDMNKEFASHTEGAEIYTMKGYDDKSVLLGILTTDTDTIIDVFSYYDENEIKTGNDLISKMKIENNIEKIEIINAKGESEEKNLINEINSLLIELKTSENKLNDTDFMDNFHGKYAGELKSINIKLKDGVIRTFDFYKSGFVFIDGYIFDLENKEKSLEIYNKL